jgi:nucleoside-diphosphate-sugar epimerase
VYNLGTGHGWTTRALADTLLRLLSAEGRNPIAARHMPAVRSRRCLVANPARAQERLGFNPSTQLEEGLVATIDDYLRLPSPHAQRYGHSAEPEELHGRL